MRRFCGLSMLACLTMLMTASSGLAQNQNLNWAEKMLSELRHDFGSVARGADVRHEIIVTNIYKEDIQISNVDTTCGCTAAKPDKTTLKTHETARILVVMDTKKFMRQKDSNVDVTFTFNGNSKTVRIPIAAYIRPDVVLSPGLADFGSVEFGSGATRNIDVSYAGREDWSIKDVRVGNEHMAVQVKPMARGAGKVNYQLVISVDKDAPLGSLNDQIELITDDENGLEVPIRITGRVEPDIVVTPATYPLGKLKPGEAKTFTVVVQGKRPFSIQNIQCDANPDCFEVMPLSKDAKLTHVVPFRVTAPMSPGEFHENFTVTIDGRPSPLVFTAEGLIAAK